MQPDEFGRGDHVRVISADQVGQVVNVVRLRKELGGGVWEYDVVGHDGRSYCAQPRDLEPAPMYVIVEHHKSGGARGPQVYDCHPDSDLQNIRERATGRQENAIRSGRPEDTYRIAELRFTETDARSLRWDLGRALAAAIPTAGGRALELMQALIVELATLDRVCRVARPAGGTDKK